MRLLRSPSPASSRGKEEGMRLLRSPSPAPLAGGKEEGMQLLLSPSPAPLTGGKEGGRRRRAVVGRGSLLAASGCLSGPSAGGRCLLPLIAPCTAVSADQEYASSFSFFPLLLLLWHLLGFSIEVFGFFLAGGWVQGSAGCSQLGLLLVLVPWIRSVAVNSLVTNY